MARRLKLLHVTTIGTGLPAASVEFGDRLTVIHGASDTGKSHIFELLNYVCGLSKSIELPPEGKGYQYVLVGFAFEGVGPLTLIRALSGGNIQLFTGDLRVLPSEISSQALKPNHTSKDPNSVSRFLMAQLGMDERYVRKNQNNQTRMLEWRDIFRLFAVDEEKILSKASPIEFGQHTARPVEAAIFRLFIQGTDDSGLTPIPKDTELKKVAENKTEILDDVITDLEERLGTAPPIDDLRMQLLRLNANLQEVSAEMETESSRRASLVQEKSRISQKLAATTERLDEVTSLIARFALLDAQYESDLSRLDLIEQASRAFDVSPVANCSFCGATPDHQHWSSGNEEGEETTEHFLPAVHSEKTKILVLLRDLRETLNALGAQQNELEYQQGSLSIYLDDLSSQIRASDEALSTPGVALGTMLKTRSRVEQQIQIHEQVHQLATWRGHVSVIDRVETNAKVSIDSKDLNRFDETARRILNEWTFPNNGSVFFSMEDRDIFVDRRPRKSRGKGVRSILHALFNVTLAEYCMKHSLNHPGIVVLDSPVVTYRQPDEPNGEGEDETITTNVVDAFYKYLQNSFSGQSIILENRSPVSPLPSGSREYFFRGPSRGNDRKGFYPTSR